MTTHTTVARVLATLRVCARGAFERREPRINQAGDKERAQGRCLVRVQPHTLHLCLDDEEVHWAFDSRGRVFSGHRGESHVQVGLDGSLLMRRGSRSFALPERPAPDVRDGLLDGIAGDVRRALELVDAGNAEVEGGSVHEARDWLENASTWDAPAFAADLQAFEKVYSPVRILPPDCYRVLVVQLTEGCSYNRCLFCSVYREVQYRAKDAKALEQHLDGIATHLGPAIALRKGVFVGDANACLLPQERLLSSMTRISERFPGPAKAGFSAFLDVFTSAGKTTAELQELRVAGLRRVTIGLESGHQPLLEWLLKPATLASVRAAVERLHAAEVSVALVVLVGAGGHTFAAHHVRDTLELLLGLPLGTKDTVYLSPLETTPGDAYAQYAGESGVVPLSDDELQEQERELRSGLADLPCKVALYDMQRWVY